MAIKFTTTKEAGQSHGVKALVFGPAGIGKTVLCSTAPAPLLISAESGLLSLKDKDVPVIVIDSIDDLREAYEFAISDKGAKFETICLDSISEIGEKVLAYEKEHAKDARMAYGVLAEKIQDIVKKFRDLPGKNVYFAAKEERKIDENGVTHIMPAMPGSKLGGQLPYYFDEVFRMELALDADDKKYRVLRTNPTFNCDLKDRSGVLDEFEEPNLTDIFNKIKGVK